jgi:solute carrier family 25 carnitine/acylcarnitine transporter 20/29
MSSESSWIDFTAGWISGGISTLAIQPVDTILTRMQANVSIHQSQNIIPSSSSSATLNKVAATQVSSATTSAATTAAMAVRPTSIFRSMISNFGITSLWRGSSAMIGAVPIQNAVLMTGYGYGKRWTTGSDDDDVENNDSSSSRSDVLLGVFMGGCVGGILQSFVMSPIELIKVSQQVIGKSGLAATSSVISGLFKPTTFTSSSYSSSSSSGGGGGRGSTTTISAWRGLGATLLRDGIPHGVWFASYEYAKVELTKYKQQNDINNNNDNERKSSSTTEDEIVIPMLSGAFAATTAWGIGYPFDLIKTRIQAGTSTGGIISTAKDIIKESSSSDGGSHAFYGLYRGFGLKLIRSIPASAIGFLVYETAAKALSSKV